MIFYETYCQLMEHNNISVLIKGDALISGYLLTVHVMLSIAEVLYYTRSSFQNNVL